MPGSSNFYVFNPNCANQEADSTYVGDSTRAGGIAFNQTMTSLLGNKIFYQQSIAIAALMGMLANKGFSPNDGSASPSTALANLEAVLANILTTADTAGLTSTATNGLGTTLPVSVTIPAGRVMLNSVIHISCGIECFASPSVGRTLQISVGGNVINSKFAIVSQSDALQVELDVSIISLTGGPGGTPVVTAYYVKTFYTPVDGATSVSLVNNSAIEASNIFLPSLPSALTISATMSNPSDGIYDNLYLSAEVL